MSTGWLPERHIQVFQVLVHELFPVVLKIRQGFPKTVFELVRVFVLPTVKIVSMDMRRAVGGVDNCYLCVFVCFRVVVVENSDEVVRLVEVR